MLCPQCQSSNRREFPTEMMIHKGHLGGAIPDLLTFPSVAAQRSPSRKMRCST